MRLSTEFTVSSRPFHLAVIVHALDLTQNPLFSTTYCIVRPRATLADNPAELALVLRYARTFNVHPPTRLAGSPAQASPKSCTSYATSPHNLKNVYTAFNGLLDARVCDLICALSSLAFTLDELG